jgi:hypothetical protein
MESSRRTSAFHKTSRGNFPPSTPLGWPLYPGGEGEGRAPGFLARGAPGGAPQGWPKRREGAGKSLWLCQPPPRLVSGQ